MIETVRFSIDGERTDLERFLNEVGAKARIIDYPARSVLYLTSTVGTPHFERIEQALRTSKVDVRRYSSFNASAKELAEEPLFSDYGCAWTDDQHKIVARPAYSGRDACPDCGKGGTELTAPLRIYTRKLRKVHLVRIPPGLFLASARLVELFHEQRWTRAEFAPVLERGSGEATDAFQQLLITSVLPPMHPSAEFVPQRFPEPCSRCRRQGYTLKGTQVIYSRAVVDQAADWNVSSEWHAPHAVSCPELICRQRVVHELLKLEPKQQWIPVKLVDD